jgi:chromate transporter
MESSIRTHDSELREVAALFFKLGVVGVGGPAAHVALMRDEVVKRRGWFTDEEFLDLLGAVNLLPGPNSTELAIHIGRRRAGVAGLIVAGLCFILPAMTLVLACAWAYVRFGRVPAVIGGWNGAKPVVIAVVVAALVGFGRTALRPAGTLAAAAIGLGLALANVHELLILLAAGLETLLLRLPPWRARAMPALVTLPWVVAIAPRAPALNWLFLYFFKIGSVLYGSGYVLLSFLRNGLVERSGLLTEGQLLDAVAVGQVTPGPVFTTATFIGYLLHGLAGGVVATVGIFLPAFLLVGASGTLVPWIRRTPLARAFLDGVNAGAVSLMGVVCWTLARSVLTTPIAWSLALLGLGLVMAGVNSAWLVAGGAIVGLVLH